MRASWSVVALAVVALAGVADARAADQPSVAVDGAGQARFVWRTPFGANQVVDERALVGASTLDDPELVSFLNRSAQAPEVAVAPDGTATFTWEDTTSGHVQARRRFNDGAFGPVVDVSGAAATFGSTHVAVGANGDAGFVWVRKNGSGVSITQTRILTAGGTLSAVQTPSPPGVNSTQGRIAVAADGDATVAWVRALSSFSSQLETRTRSAATGNYGAAQVVSTPTKSTSEPGVALDAAGDAAFVWSHSDGTNTTIQTRRRAAGGTLDTVQDLSAAADKVFFPRLAVDAGDDAAFTWQLTKGTARAQARVRAPDGQLAAIQTISDPTQNVGQEVVGIDDAGNATFGWVRSDGGATSHAQARRRSASGTSGPIVNLSPTGTITNELRVAVGSGGDAVFAWTRSGAIEGRRFPATGALGPVLTVG